jgi:hypothetical protein
MGGFLYMQNLIFFKKFCTIRILTKKVMIDDILITNYSTEINVQIKMTCTVLNISKRMG